MGVTFQSLVQHPIEEVFGWHERPGAFTRLSPPWQPLKVAAEASSLSDGAAVIRMPGGLRWVAQHSNYDPPNQFVDDLTSLPIKWHHKHRFEAAGPNATRMIDELDTWAPARFIAPMFRYRHTQLRDELDAAARLRAISAEQPTVGITGASGLIGSALTAFLTTNGMRVVRFVRRSPNGPDERQWNPLDPDPAIFSGIDAVVHLAGASIVGRLSTKHKVAIASSRIEPTRRLALAIAENGDVKTLVTASAIGYYGPDGGAAEITESTPAGSGFLAEVVREWEESATPAKEVGLRVVNIRTGLALSPRGGLLKGLYPLFFAGGGGRLGDGNAWMSWIDLDDLTDIFTRAIIDPALVGPVNATAPVPVTNREFTKTLGKVLRRPTFMSVPRFALERVVGAEATKEIVCASQNVKPQVLGDLGHTFRRPLLEDSLKHQLGRL